MLRVASCFSFPLLRRVGDGLYRLFFVVAVVLHFFISSLFSPYVLLVLSLPALTFPPASLFTALTRTLFVFLSGHQGLALACEWFFGHPTTSSLGATAAPEQGKVGRTHLCFAMSFFVSKRSGPQELLGVIERTGLASGSERPCTLGALC